MSSFQIFTPAQIELLRTGGRILRQALTETAARVRPGITTVELDRIAENVISSHEGARPAFKGYRGYPATLCTSVNDECVHGIPGQRVLREGDIIALDCGVVYGDLTTDACISVPVGTVSPDILDFLRVTEDALEQACGIVAPGLSIGDISSRVQHAVERKGYSCVNGLTGHGLGTHLHQFPDIPNTGTAGKGPLLPAWTLIAIEPITSMGRPEMREADDGWTIKTSDGSLSAHFEHTVLVTNDGHDILV